MTYLISWRNRRGNFFELFFFFFLAFDSFEQVQCQIESVPRRKLLLKIKINLWFHLRLNNLPTEPLHNSDFLPNIGVTCVSVKDVMVEFAFEIFLLFGVRNPIDDFLSILIAILTLVVIPKSDIVIC